MLNIILAQSSLELVPKEVYGSPDVKASARAKGKKPGEILLDRTFHHTAMRRLLDNDKRGRPDLVHFAALSATSTPLFEDDLMRLYIHTVAGKVIFLTEGVRLPKSFSRFVGLIEQLLKEGQAKDRGRILLRVEELNFKRLLEVLRPSFIAGLSRKGKLLPLQRISRTLVEENNPAVIVGGFPHGQFSREVISCLDELYSISDRPFESHTVISRLVYSYEISLAEKSGLPSSF